MEVASGRLVTPNVRLLKPLREGGMGSVWIAEHLTLKTQVAVKFISEELLEDEPDIRTRFANEASLAAQIKSEHVVHTYDQGLMDDGTPYIVMELLEGNTLTEWVQIDGPLSLDQTVRVVTQVAKALHRAHKLGIVHRDIKSDNIFLVDTEETEDPVFAKILDFGIAKHTKLPELDMGTKPGSIVGTPEFMSPEQMLADKPIDLQADLWALGVVAYYALTGRIPFEGQTLVKLCLAVLDGTFKPPSVHATALPASVDRWFAKALAREPEDRFDSARELAESLQQAADMPPDAIRSSSGVTEASFSGAFPPAVDQPRRADSDHDEIPPRLQKALADTERPGRPGPTFAGASSSKQPAPKRRRGWPRVLTGLVAATAAVGVGIGVAMVLEKKQIEVLPAAAPTATAAATVEPEPAPEPTETWIPGEDLLPSGSVPAEDAVSVPAGEFTMGCDPSEDESCPSAEQPPHDIHVDGFRIGRLEVTVARYAACVRAGRCTTEGLAFSELCNWTHNDRLDHPINCVDWSQASAYCQWVHMRLPTEAEWERAARGDDPRRFPWGDEEPSCAHAVMDQDGDGCGRDSTWSAGAKPSGASSYGALDMAGNVWEWVADRYDARYYRKSPRRNPMGPAAGTPRVMRGGSWLSAETTDLRAAARRGSPPGYRNYNLGFRCACDDAPDAGAGGTPDATDAPPAK